MDLKKIVSTVLRFVLLPVGFVASLGHWLATWIVLLIIFSVPGLAALLPLDSLLFFVLPLYYAYLHLRPEVRPKVVKFLDAKVGSPMDESEPEVIPDVKKSSSKAKLIPKCDECGKVFDSSEIVKKFEGRKVCSSCYYRLLGVKTQTETQCKCNQCGKVWHYIPKDQQEESRKKGYNTNKACIQSLACCGSPLGCIAFLVPNQQVRDLNQCPQCQSRDVKIEVIEYEKPSS